MGILEPQDARNRETVHSIADIIKLNEGRGPAFEPGSKWEYSNYGYVLLGADEIELLFPVDGSRRSERP